MFEMLCNNQMVGMMRISTAIALLCVFDAMPAKLVINPKIAASGNAKSAGTGAEVIDRQFREKNRTVLMPLQIDALAVLT